MEYKTEVEKVKQTIKGQSYKITFVDTESKEVFNKLILLAEDSINESVLAFENGDYASPNWISRVDVRTNNSNH